MSKEYNISKTSGQCFSCKSAMAPLQEFMAAVRETGEEFAREDYCLGCWQAHPVDGEPGVVATWRAIVPKPEAKKKLLVDDELLINFFERLGGDADAAKINFRFVLALVLMRKKILVYERMKKDATGQETWIMRFKGGEALHEVVNPNLDETKISQVSEQLGQIMQGEL